MTVRISSIEPSFDASLLFLAIGVQLKGDSLDGAVFLLIIASVWSHWKAAESICITMVARFPVLNGVLALAECQCK